MSETDEDKEEENLLKESELNDPSLAPSRILSSQEYFVRLFSFLTFSEQVGELMWGLLMELPPNQSIREDVRTFNNGNPDWNNLFHPQSTFNLYYSLCQTQSLLDSSDENHDAKEWKSKFCQLNGLKHFGQILEKKDFFEESAGSKGKVCLSSLLEFLSSFILNEETRVLDIQLATQVLDEACLAQVLYKIIGDVATHASLDSKKDDEEISKQAVKLFIALLQSFPEQRNWFLSNPEIQNWIPSTCLNCIIRGVRYHVTRGLISLAQDSSETQTQLFKLFLAIRSVAESSCETSSEYFYLLNNLLEQECQKNSGDEIFSNLASVLAKGIVDRPVMEIRNGKMEDYVLQGYMILLKTIVESTNSDIAVSLGASVPNGFGLLDYLFEQCLFGTQTLQDHGSSAPPKCKTNASRRVALNLSKAFALKAPNQYKLLTEQLQTHHVMGESRWQWSYLPKSHKKADCGYSGLKNQGATCYMNSLMQNLYMHPEYRKDVFSVKGREEDEEKDILYQYQLFLAEMQESWKKAYDTRPFVMRTVCILVCNKMLMKL